jgi:hypothetical protein
MVVLGLKHGFRKVGFLLYSMPSDLYVTLFSLWIVLGSVKSVEHTTRQVCWQQLKSKEQTDSEWNRWIITFNLTLREESYHRLYFMTIFKMFVFTNLGNLTKLTSWLSFNMVEDFF